MNISMEKIPNRVVKPVWSSNNYRDLSTSANRWPLRPQGHPRRLYGTPKNRGNYSSGLHFEPQISSLTMSVDIEQYNKHKSQSSMAFCSTSKVKYTPLHGLTQDALTGSYGSPCASIFPWVSRPTSRPVILHGKRYTIFAVQDDSPSTERSSYIKEEDRQSHKMEHISDQRRRFNEAERNKSSTKIYKENTEASEYRIRRNYCLSGHRIFIKSCKETVDERLIRLQPTLNLQNVISKKNVFIETTIGSAVKEPINHDNVPLDSDKDTIPNTDNNDSVISVNVKSGRKAETQILTVSSMVNDLVKRSIDDLVVVKIDSESHTQAKEFLVEIIKGLEKEIGQVCRTWESSVNNTDKDCLAFLSPIDIDVEVDPELIGVFEQQFGTEWVEGVSLEIFVTKMFDAEIQGNVANYWSKILSLLKIHTINASMFANITTLIRTFHNLTEEGDFQDDVALMKTYLWMQLLMTLLRINDSSDCSLSNYLEILTKVVIGRNILDEKMEKSVKESLLELVMSDSVIGALPGLEAIEDLSSVKVPLTHLIDALSWIFKTHIRIFQRQVTIDDLATIMATLADNNEV